MKKYFALLLLLIHWSVSAQITCMATADTDDAYLTFENAGFEVENPDCEHTDFGAHITQVFDEELLRNAFVFHSHIEADNDRCINFDRVRTEVKGGPHSSLGLRHPENTSSYYRWKFRLDENFIGASTFCHIFQNKPYGGDDVAAPILTITVREHTLEVRHRAGDTGTDLGKLVEADLTLFRGHWIEGYVEQLHGEHGRLIVFLKDMVTGDILLEYTNEDIDLWREGAAFNRPKWGVYRKKGNSLQDEEVKFADFCVSEVDSITCPAEAGMEIVSVLNEENKTKLSLFPNPVVGQLHLSFTEKQRGVATIFSIEGEVVQENIIIQKEKIINTNHFPKGIYFIKIQLPDGKIYVEKFIVIKI